MTTGNYTLDRPAKIRRLAAELQVLETFDAMRQSAGHDYGCGQRGAELGRRRRELEGERNLLPLFHRDDPTRPSDDELAEAFERVGRPRLRRVECEGYRHGTPTTVRTRQTWRRVARMYAQPGVRIVDGRRQYSAAWL